MANSIALSKIQKLRQIPLKNHKTVFRELKCIKFDALLVLI